MPYIKFGRSFEESLPFFFVFINVSKMRAAKLDLFMLQVLFCVSGLVSDEFDNNLNTEHSLELTQSLNLARQERIQEVCNRYNTNYTLDNLPANQLEHILIDEDHKLLYCYVPKVACTNWKRILMILTGKWNDTDVLAIPAHLAHSYGMFRNLSSVPQDQRKYMLDNFHKMIIVRNPFERLLSAFRNKLEGDAPSARYFQDRVGRRIIKAFRPNPTNKSLALGHDVSFEEFALFLTSRVAPLADVAANEHWQPVDTLCHPCLIKYTLVGKYETLVDDSLLSLHTIGVANVQMPRLPHTSRTADRLRHYFGQLNLPLVRRLYRLYKKDFDLFDYNLENVVGFDLG